MTPIGVVSNDDLIWHTPRQVCGDSALAAHEVRIQRYVSGWVDDSSAKVPRSDIGTAQYIINTANINTLQDMTNK